MNLRVWETVWMIIKCIFHYNCIKLNDIHHLIEILLSFFFPLSFINELFSAHVTGNQGGSLLPKFILKSRSVTEGPKKPRTASTDCDPSKAEEEGKSNNTTGEGITNGLQSLCQNYDSDESDWNLHIFVNWICTLNMTAKLHNCWLYLIGLNPAVVVYQKMDLKANVFSCLLNVWFDCCGINNTTDFTYYVKTGT